MLRDTRIDRLKSDEFNRIASSDDEYRRLLILWESDTEGRRFRRDVVGEKFSDRIGRGERIFRDEKDIIDRLVENMIKNVRQDLAEEKVTLWMFNRIEGDHLVFDLEKCQDVAKMALFRHYQHFSRVSDARSASRLDQIVADELKNDHRIAEPIVLPDFYLKTLEGGVV